jgi:hypothetical protein
MTSISEESFFRIFTFNHMMHDAIDYRLCYESCKIERDVVIDGVTILTKGKCYHTVYLMLDKQELLFINWEPFDKHNVAVKPIEEVVIPLSKISSQLKW